MLARKTPMRRTPFKRGKPKPERNAAMQDGINVHGAVTTLVGATDMAHDALASDGREEET